MNKNGRFYKLITNKTLLEIIKFGFVGALATLVDYLVMGLFEYIVTPSSFDNFFDVFTNKDIATWIVVVGTTLGFISGLLVNYFCSILFVYNEKGNSKSTKGFLMFLLLSAIGLGLTNLGMYIGYTVIGFNQWIVRIIMTILVMIYNYVSKRLIIFKDKKVLNDNLEVENEKD